MSGGRAGSGAGPSGPVGTLRSQVAVLTGVALLTGPAVLTGLVVLPGTGRAASGTAAAAAGAAVALVVRPPAETRLDARPAAPSGRPGRSGPEEDGRGRSPATALRRVVRRRARAGPALDDVLTLLDRLAALLRAGLGPRTVWEQLAAAPGPCRPVCAFVAESLASGGEPGRAVAGAAELLPQPGGLRPAPDTGPRDVLRWLAIATTVSARTGAPAADCVDRLAAAVRGELAAADERAGALAGPRATAQVLAWLPAGGVVLGALVGADPVRTLLLTGPGRLCLLAGGTLWGAGLAWSRALVAAASRAGE